MILTFIVVIGDDQPPELEGIGMERAELARNTATEAPWSIAAWQVVEHGLRHLAWLAREDPVVPGVRSDEWKQYLAGHVPEPFKHI